MIKQAAPAVVNIAVRATVNSPAMGRFNDPFFQQFFGRPPRPRQTQSAGSGVIVDAKAGYILTNHHVVEGADSITITLFDDRTMDDRRVSDRHIGAEPHGETVVRVNDDVVLDVRTRSDHYRCGFRPNRGAEPDGRV